MATSRRFGYLNMLSFKSRAFFKRMLWLGLLCNCLLVAHAQDVVVAEAPAYPQFKFNGDLRFRHEHVEKQGATVSVIEQQRIRARLSANVKTEESINLEFRLATGAGRTSTNQNLGGTNLANHPFLLDRANADWAAAESLHLKGGRFGNPFYQPGDSDMIWDADLNFDGLALKYKDDSLTSAPFLNAGFFWIEKNTALNRKDVVLGAVQIGLQNKISDKSRWSVEAGYYAYSGIRSHLGLATTTSTDGNTWDPQGANRIYHNSFKLIDLGFDFTTPLNEVPLTLFNHYVTNTKADPTPGVIAGVKWGALKQKSDWMLSYDYRRIPEDSTVGAFTDGDSFGGGTNGWSHKVSAAYQVGKSWNTALNYLYGRSNIEKDQVKLKRQLIQADLNYKF